mmetsp:Transcript_24018/g.50080  ORF Transcript_24018/g.50080 Transcript_24018/m.50080 type:complete len:85 (+) Transcript_24018:3351-3605(+)
MKASELKFGSFSPIPTPKDNTKTNERKKTHGTAHSHVNQVIEATSVRCQRLRSEKVEQGEDWSHDNDEYGQDQSYRGVGLDDFG